MPSPLLSGVATLAFSDLESSSYRNHTHHVRSVLAGFSAPAMRCAVDNLMCASYYSRVLILFVLANLHAVAFSVTMQRPRPFLGDDCGVIIAIDKNKIEPKVHQIWSLPSDIQGASKFILDCYQRIVDREQIVLDQLDYCARVNLFLDANGCVGLQTHVFACWIPLWDLLRGRPWPTKICRERFAKILSSPPYEPVLPGQCSSLRDRLIARVGDRLKDRLIALTTSQVFGQSNSGLFFLALLQMRKIFLVVFKAGVF